MSGQITSGVPLFTGQATSPVTQPISYNVLFNGSSISNMSHVVEVLNNAIVVRAYGLIELQKISVIMTDFDGITNVTNALVVNGKVVVLDANNTCVVIDMPGKYIFSLSGEGALGTVSAVVWESGLSYWSYGLAAYAAGSGS